MKLTKFIHSCVLLEEDGKTILFDPGMFSWQDGKFDVTVLPSLDSIVVTHKHPDHCFEPFVKALNTHSPQAQWFAPGDIHEDLKSWGVDNVTDQSSSDLQIVVGDHTHVEPFGIQVQNLQATWANKVLHPGDSHDIIETPPVLFLPVQAPWGTTVHAMELALQLKPQYVLPIHDWMWNEAWRQNCYDRFEQVLGEADIKFLHPTDGKAIEINL